MTAVDLVLAIDTTGSMATHVRELRRNLLETLSEVTRSGADLRLGAVAYKAHGDAPYLVRSLPPTRQPLRFLEFFLAPELAAGVGGGGQEALECALHAANDFTWRPSARKALVVVGDRPPCGGGVRACAHGVDWRDEVERLADARVEVFPVLVGGRLEARRAFEFMAARTGGGFVDLQHVRDLPRSISAVAHRVAGDADGFRRRLTASGELTPGLVHALAA